jgi:hypothetical protein
MASLLIIVAARPLLIGPHVRGAWIELVAGVLILLFTAFMRRRVFTTAAVLFFAAIALDILLVRTWDVADPAQRLALSVGTLLATTAFLSFVVAVILRDVLLSEPVTWNTVCGALCVYLLVGAVCAQLYVLIYLGDPGAFGGAVPAVATLASPQVLDRFTPAFLYYSFVILATLGLGDITPVSAFARTLTWLEAVFGQIYLAVLVARVVTLYKPAGQGEDAGAR